MTSLDNPYFCVIKELQQKLVQSEESGRLLQAECEQHKSTLSETVWYTKSATIKLHT